VFSQFEALLWLYQRFIWTPTIAALPAPKGSAFGLGANEPTRIEQAGWPAVGPGGSFCLDSPETYNLTADVCGTYSTFTAYQAGASPDVVAKLSEIRPNRASFVIGAATKLYDPIAAFHRTYLNAFR